MNLPDSMRCCTCQPLGLLQLQNRTMFTVSTPTDVKTWKKKKKTHKSCNSFITFLWPFNRFRGFPMMETCASQGFAGKTLCYLPLSHSLISPIKPSECSSSTLRENSLLIPSWTCCHSEFLHVAVFLNTEPTSADSKSRELCVSLTAFPPKSPTVFLLVVLIDSFPGILKVLRSFSFNFPAHPFGIQYLAMKVGAEEQRNWTDGKHTEKWQGYKSTLSTADETRWKKPFSECIYLGIT